MSFSSGFVLLPWWMCSTAYTSGGSTSFAPYPSAPYPRSASFLQFPAPRLMRVATNRTTCPVVGYHHSSTSAAHLYTSTYWRPSYQMSHLDHITSLACLRPDGSWSRTDQCSVFENILTYNMPASDAPEAEWNKIRILINLMSRALSYKHNVERHRRAK